LYINIENPDSFEQWTKAAQRHQRNWLQKHAIHSDYGGTNNQQQQPNKPSGFFWQRNQGNRPTGQAPCPCLPLRDPDAIDTSAVAWKATTEAEKEKCKKEGQCFECGKQGHLAWNCPDQKPCAQATVTEESNTTSIATAKSPLQLR
jgi:hypothetical protein